MSSNLDERVDTVVIGAGQAGLAVAYHVARLARASRQRHDLVVLEAGQRVGDNWRCHWDSLRLYTPARYDGLPGMRFPAPAWSFPGKDDVAGYLEAYAQRFDLPVRTGVRVLRVRPGDGRYVVDTGGGTIEADHVVVATGTFGRTAYVPPFAAELDPGIVQEHSSGYRNPAQLPEGPVLVVGASHSGADIAYEVVRGHPTYLSGRDTGQFPFDIEGRSGRICFPVLFFLGGHLLTVGNALGRRMREEDRRHGGPLLRVKSADLERAGVVRLTERTVGVRDGMPVLADGTVLEVCSVVWATGFRQDFGWIEMPVLGEDGWPLERRGVVASAPGLYFCGLAFQSSFRSMLIGGAGGDAEYVARHLMSRSRLRDRQRQAA